MFSTTQNARFALLFSIARRTPAAPALAGDANAAGYSYILFYSILYTGAKGWLKGG